MRPVDRSLLIFPTGWQADAVQAELAVFQIKDHALRQAEIDRNSDVWKDLKAALGSCSDQKCFYCETKQIRDDFDVDHFRPKSGKPEDGHSGYWWLAFKSDNLNFSCRFCNQRRVGLSGADGGGKGSSFPLLSGGVRAIGPSCSLEDEYPSLIDPCDTLEPSFIGFNEIGLALPQASKKDEPQEFERACISIRLYHLNHGYLRRRREQKALLIKSKISGITLLLNKAARRRGVNDQAYNDLKKEAQKRILDLRVMMNKEEEYSSLTAHVLSIFSGGDRAWINRCLLNR